MPPGQFKDHFSALADGYASFRPGYPSALFEELAREAPGRRLAWDCGTGSGQAARGLARCFARVVATDASAQQIRAARATRGVEFRVAPASASGLQDASVDLVLAAQAMHWFPLEAFFDEVRRVVKPGGVLAACCYGLMRISPAVDPVISRLYHQDLADHWPPERRYVDDGYAKLPFPFAELDLARREVRASWTLEQVMGYLGTWSALRRCHQATGTDPLAAATDELRSAWGGRGAMEIRWPLAVRAGRIT